MRELFSLLAVMGFSNLAFADAQICPTYDETKQIEIVLIERLLSSGPVATDGYGVSRARLLFNEYYCHGDDYCIYVYNSSGKIISRTGITKEKYDSLALVFSQLSVDALLSLQSIAHHLTSQASFRPVIRIDD